MQDPTVVPLAGKATYSPRGKLLLICEEENIAVHETKTGKKIGNLENIASKDYDPYHSFSFSPQETYVAYRNKIWTLADQKEFIIQEHPDSITTWNKQESIFITNLLASNAYFVVNAQTGQLLQTMVRPATNPRSYLCDDGSLIAHIYPLAHPINDKNPRTWLVITHIKKLVQIIEIPNGQRISFFSDNTHALVATQGADVTLINAQKGQKLQTFVCGNSSALIGNNTDLTPCQITLRGMQSRITHPSAKDYFCTIRYDGKEFRFQKHDKTITNKKMAHWSTPHYLARVDHKAHIMSPDGYSLVLTTSTGQHILCILPHIHELLAKERSSYFSLLSEDIRSYLKDFNV